MFKFLSRQNQCADHGTQVKASTSQLRVDFLFQLGREVYQKISENEEKKLTNVFKGHVRKGCVMECRVNGDAVQKTEIAKMIWKVAVGGMSLSMTLYPSL